MEGEDSFWAGFEACIFDEKTKHEKRPPPPPRPFLRILPEDQLVNGQEDFQFSILYCFAC